MRNVILIILIVILSNAILCQSLTTNKFMKSNKRKIHKQLETCKTETEPKIVALKEQARLIAELETRTQSAETQLKTMKKELKYYKKELSENHKQKIIPTSCIPYKFTRLEMIRLPGHRPFQVACNSGIAGSGWMVIQRRINGAVDFYRNWKEYRVGFGDLRREFFIGLEKLHLLTLYQPHELFIHMEDVHNVTTYARYSSFEIAGEEDDYKLLSLGNYTGNAGNAMRIDVNMKFTTYDRDNDLKLDRNCAKFAHGAWWYKNCSWCNLNGGYFNAKDEELIWWRETITPAAFTTRLKTVVMLIRPKGLEEFLDEVK